jgi:hypothetical protein
MIRDRDLAEHYLDKANEAQRNTREPLAHIKESI